MSIINVNLPATDAWKELMKGRVSHKLKDFMGTGKDVDIEDVKILYKLSEDGERATLYDIYLEGMKYEGDGIAVPLTSTFKYNKTLAAETKIVNVVGSSRDTMGNSDCNSGWIYLYKFITGKDADICCTDGKIYEIGQFSNEIYRAENCNANFQYNKCRVVGGHVIIANMTDGMEQEGAKYNEASVPDFNDVVAIMPICDTHNNNNHSYMVVKKETQAVVLNYYLRKNIYQNYIN